MWWCDKCEKELDEDEITYMEHCTHCGNDVELRKEVSNENR